MTEHIRNHKGLYQPRTDTLTRYVPIPEAGCWIWDGPVGTSGYGYAPGGKKGKHFAAHRLFYEAFVGSIPAGKVVCHKCDTPLCVNPDHLWVGTMKENQEDMWLKGRARPRGKLAEYQGGNSESAVRRKRSIMGKKENAA